MRFFSAGNGALRPAREMLSGVSLLTSLTAMRTFFRDIRYLFSNQDLLRFSLLVMVLALGTAVELVTLAVVPFFVALLTEINHVTAASPVLQRTLAAFQQLGISEPQQILSWSGLAFLGIFALRTVYLYFSYIVQERIIKNRCVYLGARIFSAYMQAPYSFFLQRNSQELLNTVMIEADRVTNQVMNSAVNLLRALIVMLAIVLMLLCHLPLITMLSLLTLGIFGGGFVFLNREKNKQQGEEEHCNRELAMKGIAEGIGGIKEIKILGCQHHFVASIHRALEKVYAGQRWLAVNQKILWPYLEFVTIAVMVGAMLLAMQLQQENFMGIAPSLALFAVALFRLKGCVTDCMLNFTALRYNFISVSTVCRDLRHLEALTEPEKTRRRPGRLLPLQQEIRIEQLSFRYENTTDWALQDISLEIKRGQAVALVGATGSGKSTLADVLLGLLTPGQGRVLVDGVNIQDNLQDWHRQIGYVPQSIFLLDSSIRRNIALGIPEQDIAADQIDKAIQAAQLQEFIASLPQGLDTDLGERGIRLSGGQRQRIGIARALYHNPAVLLFDEATSALDSLTEKALAQALENLRGEHTIITIAHRLSTVQNCDRLFFLKQGKLQYHGTFQELADSSAEFNAMVGNAELFAQKLEL
ncbi:MAG: ABC transporter ATP-binding protein [Oligosphaeraceae bacterium]|nr:ABC transporter ATP-binding protein [Oligosphaeraceae bacterium]